MPTTAYTARGYKRSPDRDGEEGMRGFVTVSPTEPIYLQCRKGDAPQHVSATFFMSADDARSLSIELALAANVADEIDQPSTETKE